MKITLQHISKKYNSNWIFKDLHLEINAQEKLAVLGSNGSGKSTLLQMIAGYVSPSEGKILYDTDQVSIETDIYKHMSICAPSTELIEEFTLIEYVDFYNQLKPLMASMKANEIAELCYLESAKNRMIQTYSSGMKQRLKLALAALSNTPVLLLDEPTSNLDLQGIDWYKNLISTHAMHKSIVVCSNQMNDEYFFCTQVININDYK
jgi:ABC-type multidrug transport system ATPase subunit